MATPSFDGASERRPHDRTAWPKFARSYPESDALSSLVEAFVAGRYNDVRSGEKRLRASDAPEEVKRAAAELLGRTKADPLAAVLFAATFALLAFLTVYWVQRSHHPPEPADAPPVVERVTPPRGFEPPAPPSPPPR